MTKREVYTAIVENKITDEVLEEVKAYIEALDKANANRKAKKNAEQAETDKVVLATLTNDFALASAIAKKIEGYTTSKVVASCKRLADEGKVKIAETRNGSRIVKSYALAE